MSLTRPTLIHFAATVSSFFLGWWALARIRAHGWFWSPIVICFLYVLFHGFDQQHGGLDAMRKAFYEQPDWHLYPKEYQLKMQTNRVFSTLVYPNALAGVILLLLPVVLWQCWSLTARWPRIARGVVIGLFAYLGFGCLYWTGSKGGWLVALIIGAVFLLHLDFPKKLKTAIIAAGLVLGLVAFFLRFSGYFQRGATSVSARFIYWQGAVQTFQANPVFGTGPGTFGVAFRKVKPPEAEMAKLTHNDYLEQASDSGLPGALSFTVFIVSMLALLYRNSRDAGWGFWLVWLGLLGWSLQAFIEFFLYIPALAWPAFLSFGWLWGLQRE